MLKKLSPVILGTSAVVMFNAPVHAAENPRRAPPRKFIPKRQGLPYPGKFEDLGKEVKELTEVPVVSGVRMMLIKMMFQDPQAMMPPTRGRREPKKQMTVQTQISMSPQMPNNAHSVDMTFVTSLDKHNLTGGLDFQGRVNGRYAYQWNRLTTSAKFTIMPDNPNYSTAGLEFDYKGTDFSGHIGFAPEVVTGAYTQSITPSISLGMQGMHYLNTRTLLIGAGRYSNVERKSRTGDICTFMFHPAVLQLAYCRKVTPMLSMGSEFQLSLKDHMSMTTIGAIYRRHTYTFQATLDSTWRMMSSLDLNISPMLKFSLSGSMVHFGQESQFGWGLMVGV